MDTMPLSHPSIVRALENHALTDPNKPAFIFVNETLDRLVLTRQHVWDYSRKCAAVLRKIGVNKGDVVCNTLPNSPQRLLNMLGTITAGCITMSAQTCMADGSDLVSSLNRGKATSIIADASNEKGPFSVLKPRLDTYDPVTHEVLCQDVPTLKYVIPHAMGNGSGFLESLDDEGEDLLSEEIDANDICVYMSTSGSEGVVKLVPFSSNVLLELGDVAFRAYTDNILMCDEDMGWIGGFPWTYLSIGTTRVLLDRGCAIPVNSMALQWTVAVQEKCDFCLTSPFNLLEFSEVRRNNENAETSKYTLETIIAGGGSVTRKHIQAALGEIAEKLVIFYGSTETGLSASDTIHSVDEFEDFKTGWPARYTTFKVVDINDKELPTDNIGEILIQTRQSLLHYVNDLEKTSKTFDPSGWIRLGDLGKVNAKGQLFVMGRNKFAISKGNIVYYPEVIERFVRKCHGVKDVVVVGVPDEKLFEEICALVIKQPNADIHEEDVRTFCENMVIESSSLVPKYVVFVERFPYNNRGKLDRKMMKRLACDSLHL